MLYSSNHGNCKSRPDSLTLQITRVDVNVSLSLCHINTNVKQVFDI